MKETALDWILRVLQKLAFVAFAVLLLAKAFSSLDWRLEHDTPILYYSAFLMDRYDQVPYSDIFEMNMPGTFAFYFAVGRLFGYGDAAFRIVDLALLTALLAMGFLFMRRFGRWAALWGVVLFG